MNSIYVVTVGHRKDAEPSTGDYVVPHAYENILSAVKIAKEAMDDHGGEQFFNEVEPEAKHVRRQWFSETKGIVIWLEELSVFGLAPRLKEFSHRDLCRVTGQLETDTYGPGGLEKELVDICNQALDILEKNQVPTVIVKK